MRVGWTRTETGTGTGTGNLSRERKTKNLAIKGIYYTVLYRSAGEGLRLYPTWDSGGERGV